MINDPVTKEKLVFLGTSSALSNAERDNTYMALVFKGEILLIDCAGSPVHRLSRAGLDFRKITAVIITHGHIDHVYGLPVLLFCMKLIKRYKPVRVFCPTGVEPVIKNLLGIFPTLRDVDFPIDIRSVSLDGELFYKKRGLRIYSLPAVHNTPSMGLIIELGNKRVVYSGDTAPNTILLEKAKGCNLLIHECNFSRRKSTDHTNLLDIKKIITEANPENVILTHLSPLEKFNNWKKIVRHTKKAGLAKDFMEIAL